MSCLDDNTLFELSLGQLSGQALLTAEQHVDRCARCRRALAETLRTSNLQPPKPAPLVAEQVEELKRSLR